MRDVTLVPNYSRHYCKNMQSHTLNLSFVLVCEQEKSLSSPVEGGAAVGGQVPLQLRQGGEIQAALHANVLLAFFVLQFMGAELAGVGEASAAHPAAEGGTKRAK